MSPILFLPRGREALQLEALLCYSTYAAHSESSVMLYGRALTEWEQLHDRCRDMSQSSSVVMKAIA